MSKVRIGISGWTYPGWRNAFYPEDVGRKKELAFASRALTSIEINGTFYSLQRPHTFKAWYDETPADFIFAVKAPQFMTHVLRLKNAREPLCNFLASGLLRLGHKLGPVLWQFPPNVMLKDNRFERFIRLLPHDSDAAQRLAQQHGEKMTDRSWTTIEEANPFPVRHAFEFRHPSFAHPDFLALLRAHNIAYVFAHAAEKGTYLEDLTADFVYLRLHGSGKGYKRGYSPKAIAHLTQRVRLWAKGKQPADALCLTAASTKLRERDVFVYFSNEAKVYSPTGALALIRSLSEKAKTSPAKKAA